MSNEHQQTSNFNPGKGEGSEVGVAILGYGTVGSQVLRLMQVNADGVMGRNGRKTKLLCERLIKSGCIHVVASDTHDSINRVPGLKKCADYLEKKIGRASTHRLMYENPLAILNSLEEE